MVCFYEFYQDGKFYYLITGKRSRSSVGRRPADKGADAPHPFRAQGQGSKDYQTDPLGHGHLPSEEHRSSVLCVTEWFRSDLKPENIRFEGSSVESIVKVIDFGRFGRSKLLMPKQKIVERAGSVPILRGIRTRVVVLYGA